jgi:hypothetical protein
LERNARHIQWAALEEDHRAENVGCASDVLFIVDKMPIRLNRIYAQVLKELEIKRRSLMFVHNRRHLAALCTMITGISIVFASILSAADTGACALLSPADIIKATNIMVGNGSAGAAVPGTLGKCTWVGSGDTKVIVTLTDAPHMELTIKAQQSTGADVPGLG